MTGLSTLALALPLLVVAWRTRILIRTFVGQGALSPQSAMPLARLRVRRGAIFRRLLRRGVIVNAGPADSYYLDETRYREWRSARRSRAAIAVAGVVLIALAAWLAGWLRP